MTSEDPTNLTYDLPRGSRVTLAARACWACDAIMSTFEDAFRSRCFGDAFSLCTKKPVISDGVCSA